jgi:hypothetical protein
LACSLSRTRELCLAAVSESARRVNVGDDEGVDDGLPLGQQATISRWLGDASAGAGLVLRRQRPQEANEVAGE